MYLRTTSRRNADGSVVRYVQLAHNYRKDGVTQAQVLVNLGREDKLDPDGLRRLVASINRYLGEPAAGQDVREAVGDALTVTDSRPLGAVWLLDGLWRQLGVDGALRQVLGGRRFTTDVERVLFALVANRAVDPCSKLAAAEWASCDAAIPGLQAMDEDQAYRAMDLLVEADAQAQVQEAVFFAVADLLNLVEVDLLFFDTTSTYFERDTEEAPSEERPEGGLRRYGHSKDSRSDLPQIVIGLAVTREGIPVRCWVWPGNTADVAVLPRGQGRPAGLAPRAGRHRGRPRVLLHVEPGVPAPGRWALDRRRTDARRERPGPGGAVPPGPLPGRAGQPAGQGSHPRR
jgi:hypothetical protein